MQAEIYKRGFKWRAGETILTNMTEEEKSKVLPCVCSEPEHYDYQWCSTQPSNLIQKLHPYTSIKNQLTGLCASCWAFAAVATMETLAKESGFPEEYLDLSEQFMIDNPCEENCTELHCKVRKCTDPGGCVGGNLKRTSEFIQNCGLPEEWCRPYVANDKLDCHIESCTSESEKNKRFRVSDICLVIQDINELKYALNEGPLYALMKVYNDFLSYVDGVYQRTGNYNPYAASHAIEVIGYQDDDSGPFGGGYFICKNSYGTDWGLRICEHNGKFICRNDLCTTGERGFFCIAYNQIDYFYGVNFGGPAYLYKNIIIPPHSSISGNILNYNGYSISDTNVFLKHFASHNSKWFQVRNVNPNSAGSYQFPYILNWDYRVEPKKQDLCFQPKYQDITLNNNIKNLNFCEFPLSPYNFNLSYANYNVSTFYCFLKILGKLGPSDSYLTIVISNKDISSFPDLP